MTWELGVSDQAVNDLIRALSDPDADDQEREKAALALGKLGKIALPSLIVGGESMRPPAVNCHAVLPLPESRA